MPPPADRPLPLRSDASGVTPRSVGTILRERREELGWRIDDVAQWLRIRPRLLEALETDDIAALPGIAYAVGFLRTYAQAMQLDADALVERFRTEYRGVASRKTDLVFPEPEGEGGVPVGVLIGAGLLVVAGAYAGWYKFGPHDHQAQRRVPPVAELMPGAATPATTSPQVASVMPGRAPSPETPAPGTPGLGTAAPSRPEAAPVSEPPVPSPLPVTPPGATPDVASRTVSTPEATRPPPQPPLGLPEGVVLVRAIAPVWLQVKDRDGHVLLSRVMNEGETWRGDAAFAPFHMSFGNAGGAALAAGTQTTGPLGRQGEVKRNIEVTADSVRSGAFGALSPLPPDTIPAPAAPDPGASGPGADAAPAQAAPAPRRHFPQPAPEPSAAQPSAAQPSADDLNVRQLEQPAPRR